MHQAVTDWNKGSCMLSSNKEGCRDLPVVFRLEDMDPSLTRFFPEQLSTMSRANVLIGVHGAGMMQQIWMPPEASCVVEVMHNVAGNNHYHNVAQMLGQDYFQVASGGPKVDVERSVVALKRCMEAVAPKLAALPLAQSRKAL
ncbi:MAG: hypothetical protein WDW36_002044 [Sanguina aurantia]